MLGEATARRCARIVAEAQVAGRAPSVVAAVMRDGEPVWRAAVGDARVGQEPATVGTRYRIGSITKTVTALLVLQLRDEGALDLDDRLDRHVPDAPLGQARLRDLLAHAAGAGREPSGPWWERNPGVDFATLAGTLAEDRVLPTRRAFHYSNLAFGLLGELVSRRRGRPWFEVATERVLGPLGMADTTYLAESPHATGYDVHPFADVVHEEPAYDAAAMAPAGQLWSTVDDLLRLGRHLVDPRPDVLAATTVEEMRAPQVVGDYPGWPAGYGLGVFLFREGDRTMVGHAGSMPGFLAGLVADPGTGVVAATLANCYQGPDPIGLAVDLAQRVIKDEPPLPSAWRPSGELPPAVEELLGHWYWGSSPYVVTSRAGHPADVFLARRDDTRLSRLVAEGPDRWRGVSGAHAGELLEVRRDTAGTPVELVLTTYRMRRAPYADPPEEP